MESRPPAGNSSSLAFGQGPLPLRFPLPLLPLLFLAACSTPPAPDSAASLDGALRGGDVGAREAWIVRAAAQPDAGDDRVLLAGLYSDDAGERMLAITALNNKYGDRLGYDYAASPAARSAAAERWRKKLAPTELSPHPATEAPIGLSPGTLPANTSATSASVTRP